MRRTQLVMSGAALVGAMLAGCEAPEAGSAIGVTCADVVPTTDQMLHARDLRALTEEFAIAVQTCIEEQPGAAIAVTKGKGSTSVEAKTEIGDGKTIELFEVSDVADWKSKRFGERASVASLAVITSVEGVPTSQQTTQTTIRYDTTSDSLIWTDNTAGPITYRRVMAAPPRPYTDSPLAGVGVDTNPEHVACAETRISQQAALILTDLAGGTTPGKLTPPNPLNCALD